jgi:hypothetical protein
MSAMDTSVAGAWNLLIPMSESPSCWGDSTPAFCRPLGGALARPRVVIRVFREDEAEAAPTGRGGALRRHRGGAGGA